MLWKNHQENVHMSICKVTSYEAADIHIIEHYGTLSCMPEQPIMELQKKKKEICQPET